MTRRHRARYKRREWIHARVGKLDLDWQKARSKTGFLRLFWLHFTTGWTLCMLCNLRMDVARNFCMGGPNSGGFVDSIFTTTLAWNHSNRGKQGYSPSQNLLIGFVKISNVTSVVAEVRVPGLLGQPWPCVTDEGPMNTTSEKVEFSRSP